MDDELQKQQNQYDAAKANGQQVDTPVAPNPTVPILGVELTPYTPQKSFSRIVGEDAASLAYGIPTGIAKLAEGLVTKPTDTIYEAGVGLIDGFKKLGDAQYWKEHPLLNAVNLFGFIDPAVGGLKSATIHGATDAALETAVRTAVGSGVEESVVRGAVDKSVFHNSVTQSFKVGDASIASETVINALTKAGVEDSIAAKIGAGVSENLGSTITQQASKLKMLDAIAHPLGTSVDYAKSKLDPIRRSIFGDAPNTAVGKLYGAETVAKNPEGFLKVEQWAEAQVKEQGLANTVDNRSRVMQDWIEQDPNYASLTPEQRVAHFQNYAQQDLTRLQIHQMTGTDIVTTKALPQNTVDAMLSTLKDMPTGTPVPELIKMLEDNFGNDFTNHSAEISSAIARDQTPEALSEAVSKFGTARSKVSFAKFSPEAQVLADQLEKSGYRITYAPKGKQVSFVSDIMGTTEGPKVITHGTAAENIPLIKQNGFIMGKNSAWGEAGWFSDSAKTHDLYGANKIDVTTEGLNLKTFNSVKEQMDFIKKYKGDNLADAVRKQGKYDGMIITNATEGNTFGITDQAKLDEVIARGAPEVVPKQESSISISDMQNKRSAFGRWIDRFGLSPNDPGMGAAEFTFRENFTQYAINDIGDAHGGFVKANPVQRGAKTKVSIPVQNLYDWLNKNKVAMSEARSRHLPIGADAISNSIGTVFDITEKDLLRAGFDADVAKSIYAATRKSLRAIPASVVGAGEAFVNFLRSSNKGFQKYMSQGFSKYIQAANKGRYEISPFFAAQEYIETRLNMSLMLKDFRSLPAGGAVVKAGSAIGSVGEKILGEWTPKKIVSSLEESKSYLREVVNEPTLQQVALVRDEILGRLQNTMLDSTRPDMIQIVNDASGGATVSLKDQGAFQKSIRSKNVLYNFLGQSNAKMATNFSRGLASKFGFTLEDALAYSVKDGQKIYKNPEMLQLLRESTQSVFHYQPGLLTSPLIKTLNMVWYPMRFQLKTIELAAKWMDSLTPATRAVVTNNWVHFANWSQTPEGVKWRNTSKDVFYNIINYTLAYGQIGQSIEAATKGNLFGGNMGQLGGLPLGVVTNIAQALSVIPEDPNQIDPSTGRPFKKQTPKKIVSAASFATAAEKLIVSILPSVPLYTLTGGAIKSASTGAYVKNIVDQVFGLGIGISEGKTQKQGMSELKRQYKTVPLDYTR